MKALFVIFNFCCLISIASWCEAQNATELRTLIAYTPEARKTAGSEQAIRKGAEKLIAAINAAWASKNIPGRLLLAGVTQVTDGRESSSLCSTTYRLWAKEDLQYDSINETRYKFGAPMMIFFSGSTTRCSSAQANNSIWYQLVGRNRENVPFACTTNLTSKQLVDYFTLLAKDRNFVDELKSNIILMADEAPMPVFNLATNETSAGLIISGKYATPAGKPIFQRIMMLQYQAPGYQEFRDLENNYTKPDGTFSFIVKNAGKYRHRVAGAHEIISDEIAYSGAVKLTLEKTQKNGRVALKASITDANGNPIKNAEFQLQIKDNYWTGHYSVQNAIGAADGTAVFQNINDAGRYRLRYWYTTRTSPYGWEEYHSIFSQEVEFFPDAEIELSRDDMPAFGPARLKVLYRQHTGSSIGGAFIDLYYLAPDASQAQQVAQSETNEYGAEVFNVTAPGYYYAKSHSSGVASDPIYVEARTQPLPSVSPSATPSPAPQPSASPSPSPSNKLHKPSRQDRERAKKKKEKKKRKPKK